MAQEKTPFETVEVYSPQSSSPSTFDIHYARHPYIAKWPTEPRPLKTSILSKTVYTFLDIFMCLAPVILLIKAGLVVIAARKDAGHTGTIEDPPSALTLNLIRFNTQVGELKAVIYCTPADLVQNTAHNNFYHHLCHYYCNTR